MRSASDIERDRVRSGRKRAVRPKTELLYRMGKRQLRVLQKENAAQPEHWRPSTRSECVDAPRPCPYVGCRFHLYVDVNPRTGSLKLNFPDLEPDALDISCVLDVADAGGATLEQVGVLMNVTRERVRQIEEMALHAFGREMQKLEGGQP